MLNLILDVCDRKFQFDDYEECRKRFKQIINAMRQMNYSAWGSEAFEQNRNNLNELLS